MNSNLSIQEIQELYKLHDKIKKTTATKDEKIRYAYLLKKNKEISDDEYKRLEQKIKTNSDDLETILKTLLAIGAAILLISFLLKIIKK